MAAGAQAQQRAAAVAPKPEVTHQGVYLGIHGGYGFANQELGLTGTPLSIDGLSADGGIAGGHLGYDHRIAFVTFGPWVEWTHRKLDFSVNPGILSATIGDSFAVGARLGLPVGNALPYLLVGHTWTEAEIALLGTQITSTNLKGWQFGGGIDYVAWHGLNFGLRYAYTRLENEDILGLGFLNVERDIHEVTARASYKIDFLK